MRTINERIVKTRTSGHVYALQQRERAQEARTGKRPADVTGDDVNDRREHPPGGSPLRAGRRGARRAFPNVS